MIGEIALLIKGLDTAFNLVQASLKKKKQVEQMGAEISGFFASKEAVETRLPSPKRTMDTPTQAVRWKKQSRFRTKKTASLT